MVEIADRIKQEDTPSPPYNTPGHIARPDTRAPGVLRENRVQPRKLGHVVLGSTDQESSQRLFTEGLGFKISDTVPGLAAFMRCSTDHHNVLVQQAPLAFLHHTSWQVNDIDEVGRGATMMLEKDPARHVWGLGRHHVGSNFFWYLRDPAGNFSEYYSDLDCIVDDALWTPRTWEGAARPVQLGPAAAAVVPRPRGPGRPDDRRARRALTAAPVFALPLVTPALYRIWACSSDGSGPVESRPGHTPGRRTGYPPSYRLRQEGAQGRAHADGRRG